MSKSKIGKKGQDLQRLREGGTGHGGHSAKGIKHGARGRQLEDTEHDARMGHETQEDMGYASNQ